MRQADVEEALRNEAGRSTERPVSLPALHQYIGMTGDGADCLVALADRTVFSERLLGGIRCRIRVPAAQYRSVALLRRGEGYRVRLVHRDPGLTIDFPSPSTREAAVAGRDSIASLLDLPTDEWTEAFRLPLRRPLGRQLTRSRFLRRRRTGRKADAPLISAREIIARN